MKVCIMSRREGKDLEGRAASNLASSSSSSSGTAAVGSKGTFSIGGTIGTSSAIDSTLSLFVVPAVGSTVLFYVKRCIREVAFFGCNDTDQL